MLVTNLNLPRGWLCDHYRPFCRTHQYSKCPYPPARGPRLPAPCRPSATSPSKGLIITPWSQSKSNLVIQLTLSLTTAAVKPTPELPLPVVYTPLGATVAMYLSNCDFATPGSPIKHILISPRIFIPSGRRLRWKWKHNERLGDVP